MSRPEILDEDIDAIDGAPLPREQSRVIGHAGAEAAFLAAYEAGRMHHAWLFGGPEGVGKATFAFLAARLLLGAPVLGEGGSIATDPSHPVAGKVARLSHPDLFLLRRTARDAGAAIRRSIAVEDVRKALHRISETAGEASWRVVIVDAVEDLTPAPANALLKAVEEPPARTAFFLVSHRPAGVLPTLRSRCRRLTFGPLGDADLLACLQNILPDVAEGERREAAEAAEGSVRRALRLLAPGGLDPVRRTTALLATLPELDIRALHALADRVSRKDGENAATTVRETVLAWARRRIQEGATSGEPTAALARFADAVAAVEARQKASDIYNLDRKQLVIATFIDLAAALGRRAA